MMARVIDGNGSVVREIAPHEMFSNTAISPHVVFRSVHRELANRRSGSASTKKRDEISGGGRKPWRQKGTGRARQGSIRSPQWRHGGVVFGPQPRSYSEALNKKERRAALVSALADRFGNSAVTLLDASTFSPAKTAQCVQLFFGERKAQRNAPRTLVVTARSEQNAAELKRASRNLARMAVTDTGSLDVKDVLGARRLVLTVAAYDALVESLSERKD